ncbi:UNVERIFIED_CONTAM: hypothetical protein ACS92_08510 [Bacillus cereus]
MSRKPPAPASKSSARVRRRYRRANPGPPAVAWWWFSPSRGDRLYKPAVAWAFSAPGGLPWLLAAGEGATPYVGCYGRENAQPGRTQTRADGRGTKPYALLQGAGRRGAGVSRHQDLRHAVDAVKRVAAGSLGVRGHTRHLNMRSGPGTAPPRLHLRVRIRQ